VEQGTNRKRVGKATGVSASTLGDFLDVAGHELRAPLTALKGHAQILQRRLAKQPERAADLDELQRMLYQIERLEHEIDVYLEAARMQSGRFQLMPESGDVVSLAQRLVGVYALNAGDDVIRFEWTEETIIAEWDRRRVRLALGALLANAVKYGLGNEIVVRLSSTPNDVRFEVLDRGLGIPARERRRVFGAYATGSNAENAGLGLGLFVAREIVRRHGGHMSMRARSGGGSIFWFELPLAVAESPKARRNSARRTRAVSDVPEAVASVAAVSAAK
jgi:signal transduction histidine kinase